MKPDPFVDFTALAIEYELTAMLDAIPDVWKTQSFWTELKSLCPDTLLSTLMVGARLSPHPPTLL